MKGLSRTFSPNRMMTLFLFRDIFMRNSGCGKWNFKTHVAAGRVSELVGKKALDLDRDMRRLGMVFAAENSLKEVEKDSATLSECNNYTAGVNAYIESLSKSKLPSNTKYLDIILKNGSNLKTALFLKFMSLDLAGAENDLSLPMRNQFLLQEILTKYIQQLWIRLIPLFQKELFFQSPE